MATPKPKQASIQETQEEEEEYTDPLVYNMWIHGGVNITMAENSTIIFQTGKPRDPVPPNP